MGKMRQSHLIVAVTGPVQSSIYRADGFKLVCVQMGALHLSTNASSSTCTIVPLHVRTLFLQVQVKKMVKLLSYKEQL
jgi:hypothetical protein